MKVELVKNWVIDSVKPQEIQKFQSELEQKKLKETTEKQKSGKFFEKINEEVMKEIANVIQKFLEKFNLETKVVYDKEYKTLVVKVYEKDTGKLIRQIPPEELLEVSKRLHELVGILYRNKA